MKQAGRARPSPNCLGRSQPSVTCSSPLNLLSYERPPSHSKNRLIYAENLSEGTVSEAVAFPRKIVEGALKYRATSVIIGHNHPGGLAEPSEKDDAVTREIKGALGTVSISLQEHVIVATDGYFSYRQTGQLGGACG